MFRTLVYFDDSKVAEYKSLIKGEKGVSFKNVKVSNEKRSDIGISILSGGVSGSSEMDGEILNNFLLDCREFEDLLENMEQYFDFIQNGDYDIETIPRSSIIRFNGTFERPAEFDMLELINQFRPMLVKSIDTDSDEEFDMLNSLLGKESTKVPIFIENDESFCSRLGFSKINSNYLYCDMDSLDDFENEDVTIIAKVLFKRNVMGKPVVVYDVMKDLFSMSRPIRRQFANEPIEGINNISIDENFITLEVLAIYQ